MFLRTLLATMALALPAWAQAIAVPDCTVDLTVAKDLKLDVVYRCRAATALTFEPDDQQIAAQVSGYRNTKVEPVNGIVKPGFGCGRLVRAQSRCTSFSSSGCA